MRPMRIDVGGGAILRAMDGYWFWVGADGDACPARPGLANMANLLQEARQLIDQLREDLSTWTPGEILKEATDFLDKTGAPKQAAPEIPKAEEVLVRRVNAVDKILEAQAARAGDTERQIGLLMRELNKLRSEFEDSLKKGASR